ncbi:hypothetical protein B0H17DRAFT_1139201 [Mycena rosella]|uniref:Uncharacterized protein n=1 Tax=Mycena rosella TaxID=1033263 RepID=A0AAD7G8V2_MYCRO|nr:hypothetical protein B0H17DRAFT_1139201 [Mycena rosella]
MQFSIFCLRTKPSSSLKLKPPASEPSAHKLRLPRNLIWGATTRWDTGGRTAHWHADSRRSTVDFPTHAAINNYPPASYADLGYSNCERRSSFFEGPQPGCLYSLCRLPALIPINSLVQALSSRSPQNFPAIQISHLLGWVSARPIYKVSSSCAYDSGENVKMGQICPSVTDIQEERIGGKHWREGIENISGEIATGSRMASSWR